MHGIDNIVMNRQAITLEQKMVPSVRYQNQHKLFAGTFTKIANIKKKLFGLTNFGIKNVTYQ